MNKISLLSFLILTLVILTCAKDESQLLLLTVASDKTDGFERYLRSTQIYGLKGKVLGLGEEWKGGDMSQPGGGYKINLLAKEMEQYKDDKDLIVLFSDSYDVIFQSEPEVIIEKFLKFKRSVVFSAENSCWPDISLISKYPETSGYRFLNSGAFIGYADILYSILTHAKVADTEDDQLYYSKIYVDESLRLKFSIALDSTGEMFQNLNEAVSDIELKFNENGYAYLRNIVYDVTPVLVHGNGPKKILLNHLGNYLAKSWNNKEGCLSCNDDILESFPDPLPSIHMGIYITKPTPFLEEVLSKISELNYSKDNINIKVYNYITYHKNLVEEWMIANEPEYNSIDYEFVKNDTPIDQIKNQELENCRNNPESCDFYFGLDSNVMLDDSEVLTSLIKQNREIIAPLLVRPRKSWSNFWGGLSSEGFYSRSSDYMDIIDYKRIGLWNVPYISSAILIKGLALRDKLISATHSSEDFDEDMAFCSSLRKLGVFMYVSNREEFGHLIDNDEFVTTNTDKYNELWEVKNNPVDWENRYISLNYTKNFDNENPIYTMPCTDVYNFPVFTERFAKEFIDTMETYGKWSDGSNKDDRLSGGYEAVPTIDIHMNHVNFDKEWLYFLDNYIKPLQQMVFIGYFNTPRADLSFIVRYKPDEQPLLRPHHDSSTYTINVALNKDYEGGGCRFIRQNCTVLKNEIGYVLMHPGRLTHYHEGLKVTGGTRYIMITFIDP